MLPIIHVWTDGSGTTADAPGGWAYVLVAEHPTTGETLRRVEGSGRVHTDGTNNRMELTAVLEGLRALRRPSAVVVHSDSEYVIKAFTQDWITRWRRKGWRKVKNPDLWQALMAAADPHMIEWTWCEGHAGIEENERCDELAGRERRQAIEEVNPPSLSV